MARKKRNTSLLGVVVEVLWRDPCSASGWCYRSEVPDPAAVLTSCSTWGELLTNDEDYLVIASSYNNAGMVGDITFIPKSLVDEVRPLSYSTVGG